MKKRLAFALLLAITAGGCSTGGLLTSTEPQQTMYTLRPVASKGAAPDMSARIVEITSPSLPPGMDGDRIALFFDGGRKVDYYAGARWSSGLDALIQDFTRRTASAALPYIVAVTPDQGIDADYKLQMKVNEFQPVYDGDVGAAPMLKVNVEFTLIRNASETIVTSFRLSSSQPAPDNRLDAITAGLESLLQTLEQDAFAKIGTKLRASNAE